MVAQKYCQRAFAVSVCLLAGCISSITSLKVLTIGDFGDSAASGIINQETVALAMSDYCGLNGCDFIVSTADNFYQSGVTSVDDPRFNTSWRWVYDKPHISNQQWYMSLGNHDYGTIDQRELFQVEFGQIEPRWYLPWLWYDFIATDGDLSVHFIIVDAMSILLRRYEWEAEIDWFNKTLAESTADWKIVIEHYPPFSAGNYGPGSLVHRNALVPIAEQYGLDLFMAGHDHNLQHIAKYNSDEFYIDYIVSGGGGRGLYALDTRANQTLIDLGYQTKYFGYHHGFVMLEISKDSMRVDYIDKQAENVYSFTRTGDTRKASRP